VQKRERGKKKKKESARRSTSLGDFRGGEEFRKKREYQRGSKFARRGDGFRASEEVKKIDEGEEATANW